MHFIKHITVYFSFVSKNRIIFSADMTIKLKHELIFNNFKTVDGGGANVHVKEGC